MLDRHIMQTRAIAERTWAIVLAGGEGTRLTPLSVALCGRQVPKQFVRVDGGPSMLQATLERVGHIVEPRRTVVVMGRAHVEWAREQLGEAEVTTLVQPAGRGTAAAILYALAWIQLHDRAPRVLVFPSDHHVDPLSPFLGAVRRAARAASLYGRLTVVGVVPDEPDPDYGWILPGPPVGNSCRKLASFTEKPAAAVANRLFLGGGMWNTFIFAAPAAALWTLARLHVPAHADGFAALDRFAFVPGARELDELYSRLEPADFSRDVLQPSNELLVVPMQRARWTDLGTPERVLATLRGTPAEERVAARLRRGSSMSPTP